MCYLSEEKAGSVGASPFGAARGKVQARKHAARLHSNKDILSLCSIRQAIQLSYGIPYDPAASLYHFVND